LAQAILELDVEFIDRGCSGMAGTFGLARDHFRTSLRAGRPLLNRLRDDDIEIGAAECGACRMQMEQGSPKRTLHPVKLLSLSYGLNPALLRHFKAPKPRHEVSWPDGATLVLGLTPWFGAAILPADCPVTSHVLNRSIVTLRMRTGDASRRR